MPRLRPLPPIGGSAQQSGSKPLFSPEEQELFRKAAAEEPWTPLLGSDD
jgi:hypothetical protein